MEASMTAVRSSSDLQTHGLSQSRTAFYFCWSSEQAQLWRKCIGKYIRHQLLLLDTYLVSCCVCCRVENITWPLPFRANAAVIDPEREIFSMQVHASLTDIFAVCSRIPSPQHLQLLTCVRKFFVDVESLVSKYRVIFFVHVGPAQWKRWPRRPPSYTISTSVRKNAYTAAFHWSFSHAL